MTAVVEASGLGKVHGRGEAAVTALQDVDLTRASRHRAQARWSDSCLHHGHGKP